ncbi:CD63 antigen, partial [Paragonimus westermani]
KLLSKGALCLQKMAGLSFGMKCLKCAVFFFNVICFVCFESVTIIFQICALVLITVGVYVQVNFSSYGPELQKVWQAAPIAIIVLGAVILLVSFLGCCGAIKENVCMLYMYGVFLIILLIAELVAAVMAVVYKDKFECCGASGPEDYSVDVPDSCGTYKEGCSEKFAQFLKQKMVIIACVAFGVCFIQILSAIIAFCLGNRIRNYDNI